ncbi:HAMP domain-containing sensor histidine kinase [Nonomuraea sp. NPDC049421]|uniref:sensor histidine kinase n=1 Tax=Nonomuraea sp. NPDC049421 TaxID=3155275 RepID=UPI003443B6A0
MIGPRSGTVGARFTMMYATVFLLSGAALLALSFFLSGGVEVTVPAEGVPGQSADQRIRELEERLAAAYDEQARRLLIGSVLAMAVMAVVSVLVGRMLAKRVLRPLRDITATTRRISSDTLDRRLAVTGPADEVKDLADTIDGLLERLEAAFTAQRRFVANASHELRTPLATMRASLDVAVAKPDPDPSTVALAARLRRQLDRVDHLVNGFLALARVQHGALAKAEGIDLADLVQAALAERDVKDLTVTTDVRTKATGDPELLARLVDNLVDNAVRHNEDGGFIEITGIGRTLVVETGGPVLDQREVDRLARPFERLGRARTGSSGLGLSIVAAVAEAHGGRLDLLARPSGGLRATVTLPA